MLHNFQMSESSNVVIFLFSVQMFTQMASGSHLVKMHSFGIASAGLSLEIYIFCEGSSDCLGIVRVQCQCLPFALPKILAFI